MERLKSYKNLWGVELHKLFSPKSRKWGVMFCIFIFASIPWLILRNFAAKFESFKWYYMDESYLNFIIYETASKFTWIVIIVIPWFYHLLFGEERRHFLKKSNNIFTQIIYTKAGMFAIMGFILIALSWMSTYILYRYICISQGIETEPNAIFAMLDPAAHFYLRYVAVFPLIISLFLSLNKNSSYLTLVTMLLFSAFLISRIPFHFHYNVHHAAFNRQNTILTVIGGLVLASGLFTYYRFISTKAHVFP